VNTQEALGVLGLGTTTDLAEVRAAFRRLVREHHPDVAGATETAQAARLTEAYALLRQVADESGTIAAAPPSPPPPAAARPTSAYDDAVAAELAAGDTLVLHAPMRDAFAALFEAAGHIGHVAYFDQQLGILEAIVRFEGGPSCSLLLTLQGRAHGTEVFCTMESIEALPTPPLRPVIDALLVALAAPA
jgi:hypothetical protein